MQTAMQVVKSTAKRSGKSSEFAKIKGQRPTYMNLDPHSIAIDPCYQRGEDRAKSLMIARNWNWNAFNAPSIARRADGSYYAYNGQHTIVAAILRGDILNIPCMVRDIDDVADEARAFLQLNNGKQPTRFDKHKAAAVAGEGAAKMVSDVLAEFGIELSKSNYGPRKTTAIGALYSILGKATEAGKARLRTVIETILLTWPADDRALSGRFVEGIARFMSAADKKGVDLEKAMARLGRNPTGYYLARAETNAKLLGRPILRTLVDFLVEAHDTKLRDGRIGAVEHE